MTESNGLYEDGAQLSEEEAKRVDIGDVGEEPEDSGDEVRDGK